MFRIGEFSRIARVTTRQLRYYEECGLLQPARIDNETGYRYYSASQLPCLNQILVLKELGLSLDQIARVLDEHIAVDELRGMLAIKKMQLEQVVKDELLRIRQIENRIEQLDKDSSPNFYNVVVQMIPEQRILSVRTTVESVERGIDLMYEINRLLPMNAGRASLGNLIIIMGSEEYKTEDIDIEIGFQVKHEIADEIQLSNGLQLSLSTIPAVEQMATLVREGLYEDNIKCYGVLGSWIEENGYRIAGKGCEVIITPLIRGNESQTFVETQIPVTKD
jgi:DNA-binding transcriptional MerR regulator